MLLWLPAPRCFPCGGLGRLGVASAVMLDVHRPVARSRRREQQVGLAHPPGAIVGRKAAADDKRHRGGHRRKRGSLPFGPLLVVGFGDKTRAGMQVEQPGHDLFLEGDAAGEHAAKRGRCRQRLARADRVPLRTNRALFSDVPALGRHGRDVVASCHVPNRTQRLCQSAPACAGRSSETASGTATGTASAITTATGVGTAAGATGSSGTGLIATIGSASAVERASLVIPQAAESAAATSSVILTGPPARCSW